MQLKLNNVHLFKKNMKILNIRPTGQQYSPAHYIVYQRLLKQWKHDTMKIKKMMLITLLLLTILTIGAVSASDDISDDNLTVPDDESSIEEAPSDDVIADSNDDVIADGSDELLGDEEGNLKLLIQNTAPRWGSDANLAAIANYGNQNVTGKLTLKADGKTFAEKTITLPPRSVDFITASEFKDLPIGKFLLNVSFATNGLRTLSDQEPVEVMPNVDYMSHLASNQDHYLKIQAPASFSGIAYVYVYDEVNDKEGDLVTQSTFSGETYILMPKLQKGQYSYIVKFKSATYNPTRGIIIDLNVIDNNPNITVTATPLELIVGNPITVTASGSLGVFALYVDFKLKEYNESATSFKSILSNLPVGKHIVQIAHYTNDGGNLDFIKTFSVTVKNKPAPKTTIKLTLKKVKVKKSAKKLVISATLKINGKVAKGKKLKFKFNKKSYTAKTNKKGVAKITIRKKFLKKLKVGKKVKYQVTYSKKTVKRSVKVKK